MRKRLWGIILVSIGAVLAILAAVWMTVIFPSFDKIPADYNENLVFEGNYSVANSTGQLNLIPVIVTRIQTANESANGIMLIDENLTVALPSGQPLPDFDLPSQFTIDRATREHLVNYTSTAQRNGYWSPPSHLKEGENFLMWIPAAVDNVTAKYTGTEEVEGLKAFTYTINETDLKSAQPQFQLLDTQITLKVEPESGTVVDESSLTTFYIQPVPQVKMKAFISDIRFTQDTVDEFVDTGRDARSMLRWFGLYVPWIVIGLGIVLFIGGMVFMVRKGAQKA